MAHAVATKVPMSCHEVFLTSSVVLMVLQKFLQMVPMAGFKKPIVFLSQTTGLT